MSLFDDIMADAAPVLLEQLGSTGQVVYLDPLYDDVPLTAIIGPERTDEEEDFEGGRQRRRSREVIISTDANYAGGYVAAPAEHAVLKINDVTWSIVGIESRNGKLARLRVERTESVEKSRPGYRKK